MVSVVLDSDFLSSFLKIGELHRVREYFRVEDLRVPEAVFRELAVTSLLHELTDIPWVVVQEVTPAALEAAATVGQSDFLELGAGEREAIALAHQLAEHVLLTNDRKALRYAQDIGVDTVNVPAFLLMYKFSGRKATAQVAELVTALENKDHYGFPDHLRKLLLA